MVAPEVPQVVPGQGWALHGARWELEEKLKQQGLYAKERLPEGIPPGQVSRENLNIQEGLRDVGSGEYSSSWPSRDVQGVVSAGYGGNTEKHLSFPELSSLLLSLPRFQTKRGRQVCANPSDAWVQSYVEDLELN